MLSLDDYQTLMRELAEEEKRRAKMQGELSQLMKGLNGFGCPTVKAAKKKLAKLTRLQEQITKEYDPALAEFRRLLKEAKGDKGT